MEAVYYSPKTKRMMVIFGYGIGNHLSYNYLAECVSKLKYLFPKLTIKKCKELTFHDIPNSRRYKYMWYTVFDYDWDDVDRGNKEDRSKVYVLTQENSEYPFSFVFQ